MPREKLQRPLPLFNRIYRPRRADHYHDQLNVWCDRLGVPHIEFQTTAFVDSSTGRPVYEAVPIFPRFDVCRPLDDYTRRRASKPRAQQASKRALRRAGLFNGIIRWDFERAFIGWTATPYVYGNREPLRDTRFIGRGSSIKDAKEDSARRLLTEGLCVTS
ncbi:hypothetical protein RhiJN_19732 [Ceratobasidium sp. AG-Ba]|nr:hypothetical protein RhiJN_04902 [Ceratobasidium sp. AG-Ba]QRV91714.1 hypothetical protein RhiJN_19732 [Ceratobasidium sp. AG-Ba]